MQLPDALHLPPVAQGIIALSAVALAIVRLLTASRPFWASTPAWLQKALPAVLMAIAALPTAIEHARSWLDVLVAAVVSASMYWTASRGDKRPPVDKDGGPRQDRVPSDPSGPVSLMPDPVREVAQDRSRLHNDPPNAAGFRGLALALLCCLLVNCSGRPVSWPKVLSCAEPLEPALVAEVSKVLAGTGDVQTDLEALVPRYAPGILECAVQQIVGDLGSAPVTARASRQVVRGRAFLESVQR